VTFAPGSTAPVESITVPPMEPNPCAAAGITDPMKTAATKRPLEKKRLIIIV
jgi:hypothetical protein